MTRPPEPSTPVQASALMLIPGRWAEQALCAQSDPNAWFPEPGGRGQPAALRICAACPVRAQCLDHALAGADTWQGISTGIWGGTTPAERRAIRRAHRQAAA
jgi:WhiB family redox-sensing transcriptional regulator